MTEQNSEMVSSDNIGFAEQKDNFEISKNTRGYNYCFKVHSNDSGELKKKVVEMNNFAREEIKRLIKLDEEQKW